ncbi:MAG TPA: NUDIX domain-containing protein [Candidatus Paceibacterota bacterium]|nr:NUDIX domain-containing protein [Candidatus Paceibacterota bacterium]
MRKRATAVILDRGNILLFRRVKPEREYYIFPGGGVEEGESVEDALKREVKEETTLNILSARHLFTVQLDVPEFATIHTGDREEYVFLVEKYSGTPELSGPEKQRASIDNQYHLEWKSVAGLEDLKNLYPIEVVKGLVLVLK